MKRKSLNLHKMCHEIILKKSLNKMQNYDSNNRIKNVKLNK